MEYKPKDCITGAYFQCPGTYVPVQDEVKKTVTYVTGELNFSIPIQQKGKSESEKEVTVSSVGPPNVVYYNKSAVRKRTYKVVKK